MDDQIPTTSRLFPLLRHVIAVAVAILISFASFLLFSRNNNFPINYQPDEQSKAYQIDSPEQRRNFSHPLLMLESANLTRKWFLSTDPDRREMVIAGRSTSAALAAIGVLGVILGSYFAFGYAGLFITAATMALCPPLLVYAHYFKEDASLAAGVCVTLFGVAWVIHAHRLWNQLLGAIILGVACATVASSKYVGVMVVPAAILAVCIASNSKWWRILLRLGLMLVVMFVSIIAINARAFESFFPPRLLPIAIDRIQFSFAHGTTGHYGIALSKPNLYCLKMSLSDLMPHLWILGIISAVVLIHRKRTTRWGIVLCAFAATIATTLACDAIPFGRYALPLTIVLYFVIAQMIVAALPQLPRFRWAMVIVCLGVIVPLQLYRCINFNNQFANDSRQRIRDWVEGNLPPGSLVITERYSGLEEPDRDHFPPFELGVRVLGEDFVADFAGSVEELANRGADYVAVAAPAYDRFFVPGVHGTADKPDYLASKQKFYSELFAKGQLVWSALPEPPTHALVNPELRIYRISQLRDPNQSNNRQMYPPLQQERSPQRTRNRY